VCVKQLTLTNSTIHFQNFVSTAPRHDNRCFHKHQLGTQVARPSACPRRVVNSDLVAAEVPRTLHPLDQYASRTSEKQASTVEKRDESTSAVRSWSDRCCGLTSKARMRSWPEGLAGRWAAPVLVGPSQRSVTIC